MNKALLTPVVRHIRKLAGADPAAEASDAELLRRFVTDHEERAFAALLRRHGPLVWGVCWQVLHHREDAEDAFQASFLVLARQAGSIRRTEAVAGWLYRVAYRLAKKAGQGMAKRRARERQGDRREVSRPETEAAWRELQAVLHEELERLPEKYRAPFVVCCLEGKSGPDAARQLGWKVGTVTGRLTKARKLLQHRLARRGVLLSAVLAAAAVSRAGAAVAAVALSEGTVQAALAFSGRGTKAGVVSARAAALAGGMARGLLAGKPKVATLTVLAAGLIVTALGVLGRQALAARAQPGESQQSEASGEKAGPAAQAGPDNADEHDAVTFTGHVLDPHGKPVAGAKLHLVVQSWRRKPLHVQTPAGSDGAFRLSVTVAQARAYTEDSPWRRTWLVALAEGFGPAVSATDELASPGDLTLRLARDDVPIRGRILDLQGKPIGGVTVRVDELSMPAAGDLGPWLHALEANRQDADPVEARFLERVLLPQVRPLFPSVRTDAEGRFQLKGIGRERIVRLTLDGPTIAHSQVSVRTRPGKPIHAGLSSDDPGEGRLTYYGATFDHVAAPSRPIIGVVRDKDTGKPLPGVRLLSDQFAGTNRGGDSRVRTVTDRHGRYRLVGLPKGRGNVIKAAPAAGQPYLQSEREVEDAPGLWPVTVNFDLTRGVVVKGRVLDQATGKPVFANVQYFVFADNLRSRNVAGLTVEHSLETGADGSFQLVALPGRGVLLARAWNDHYRAAVGADKMQPWDGTHNFLLTVPFLCDPGGFHRVVELNPSATAGSLRQDLVLDPGTMPHGRVLGPDGSPVSGARALGLTAYGSSRNWTRTPLKTADFTVWGLDPKEEREVVFVQPAKRLAAALRVRGDARAPLTVRLESWGVVSGRLVSPHGRPEPDVLLRFAGWKLPENSLRTDKAGRFRVAGLAPEVAYTLEAMRGDQVAARVFTNLTVKGGETKDLGDIKVKPQE
jgi:RNA polymerase sigma factor (sigma-70 family)